MRFIHQLTHRHLWMDKEGLGELVVCSLRWPWAPVTVMFKPELPDAGWHKIPADDDVLRRVTAAGSPLEAMAVLRRVGDS
jgi:hypothetical protein